MKKFVQSVEPSATAASGVDKQAIAQANLSEEKDIKELLGANNEVENMSDGTGATTSVVDAETGEPLENVMALEITMDAFNLEAAILIKDPELNIDQIEVQEVRQGAATGHVRGAGAPDNQ